MQLLCNKVPCGRLSYCVNVVPVTCETDLSEFDFHCTKSLKKRPRLLVVKKHVSMHFI